VSAMRIFRVTIGVENVAQRGVVRYVADALVDTGSELTWIPRAILQSIGIKVERRRSFIVADGRLVERDIGYAVVHAGESSTVDAGPVLAASSL
jgi:predicted aspartyl protease